MPYYYYRPDLTDLRAITVTFLIALAVISVAVMALWIVINWRLLKKAGKPGWIALIPFYNTWTLYEIATGHGAYMLLLFIPVANVIVSIYYYVKLSVSFSKDEAYCLGLIFLPLIFHSILAFGKSVYVGPNGRVSVDYNGRYQRNYAGTPYGPAGTQYGYQQVNRPPYGQTQTRVTSNFCPNCGAPISGNRFCGNCGYDIINNR